MGTTFGPHLPATTPYTESQQAPPMSLVSGSVLPLDGRMLMQPLSGGSLREAQRRVEREVRINLGPPRPTITGGDSFQGSGITEPSPEQQIVAFGSRWIQRMAVSRTEVAQE